MSFKMTIHVFAIQTVRPDNVVVALILNALNVSPVIIFLIHLNAAAQIKLHIKVSVFFALVFLINVKFALMKIHALNVNLTFMLWMIIINVRLALAY